MNIVILDDSEYKRRHIKQYMDMIVEDAKYKEFAAFHPTLKYLMDHKDELDILLLDWNFPLFQGEMPKVDLGKDFLRTMKRQKIFIPTIICSTDNVILTGDYEDIVVDQIKCDSSVYLKPHFEKAIQKIKTRNEGKK